MRRGGAAVVLACVAASALGAGCEQILGANFDVEAVQCSHVGPPEKQSVASASGEIEFIVYIASSNSGDVMGKTDYNHVGFDLDGLCTYQSQGPSCRSFAWAGADPTDGVNGIDNKIGQLMFAEGPVFGARPLSSDILNAGVADGNYLPLVVFRVQGYDGASADDHVDVDWYVPVQDPTADAGIPAMGQLAGPWSIRADTLAGGGVGALEGGAPYPQSIFHDANAYVANYEVVAHFPTGTLLTMANTPFALDGAEVVLHITPNPMGIDVGTLAGRLREKELFAKTPIITPKITGVTTCTDFPTYPQIKKYYCSFADILADGTVDPSKDCDAISIGMELTLGEATLGAPVMVAPLVSPCAPKLDPANDTCATPTTPIPVDAGPGRINDPLNCVKPGTMGNELGVGGYCEVAGDCPNGTLCGAQYGAPAHDWFCTKLCMMDQDCGSGAYCAHAAQGIACVPFVCAPSDGGAEGGADGSTDGPTDASADSRGE